jgi:hypothetical protein
MNKKYKYLQIPENNIELILEELALITYEGNEKVIEAINSIEVFVMPLDIEDILEEIEVIKREEE